MAQKIILSLINLVFGSMVLLSYRYGVNKVVDMGKDPSKFLWGGVPDALQPIIVVFMFIGAAGYFLFTYNFLFNVSTDRVFLGRFSYSSLHMLYLLIFIPSMVWLGLTIDYIDSQSSVFDNIRSWADVRGIYEDGNAHTQYVKLQEEAGELAKALLQDNHEEIVDAIGDIVVVLTNLAHLEGVKIETCIASAYNQIKNRKGEMINGTFVKDER